MDGVADCMDECPKDMNKIETGICGCGMEDMDTDKDSVANCKDGCPNDMLKMEPGVCGCGTLDGTELLC